MVFSTRTPSSLTYPRRARLLRYDVPSSPHHPTIAPPQLDEDAREQREIELKRKRMLRRRTEGQGDDDRGGEEEAAAAAAMLGGEGDGQVRCWAGQRGLSDGLGLRTYVRTTDRADS